MESHKASAAPATRPVAADQTSRLLRQYLLVAGLYVCLIFILPPNTHVLHQYHLTGIAYRVITFAIALPSLAVWLAAFIGYDRLRRYAVDIAETPEGPHFGRLTQACQWLAWSLPVTIIVPFILNALAAHWSGLHPTVVVLTNYLNLVLPLVAFTIIADASRGLVSEANLKFSLVRTRFIIFASIAFGVLYCLLTFQRFDLHQLGGSHNSYFLPLWLVVTTITIPYLYAWFVGLLAVYEVDLFSRNVPGVLYRQAMRLVVGGLLAVILSSVALQYLTSVQPRVGYLVLDYRVVVTALCRIAAGIGFVLLAIGVSRLRKIEEV